MPNNNNSPYDRTLEQRQWISTDSTTPISSSTPKPSESAVGDGSFEALLRERTRLRKEKEEHSVAELRVQMVSMERALAAEVQRRIYSVTQMELKCRETIGQMEAKCQDVLDQRLGHMETRLQQVEQSLEQLTTESHQSLSHDIPQQIRTQSTTLKESLDDLNQSLTLERNERLGRDQRLGEQVDHFSKSWNSQMDQERAERLEGMAQVHDTFRLTSDQHETAAQHLEQTMQDELADLGAQIERERKERTMEDDEIVNALNRYTDYLQTSLNVISDD
eukprot:CAMPEP_0198284590 /NCGR_PEP_ID=MMETSP1449-20131203/4050_1 /TAXON_ID=420275 /ORGANISM="Attheya septentrionalis, Strain CCMP2084" /LENGTH=276 /DNA_ID=CAMNT_0043981735 /DNA_START=79 /DNA_END=909 /DNA_ORIENTATION=-